MDSNFLQLGEVLDGLSEVLDGGGLELEVCEAFDRGDLELEGFGAGGGTTDTEEPMLRLPFGEDCDTASAWAQPTPEPLPSASNSMGSSRIAGKPRAFKETSRKRNNENNSDVCLSA